MEIVEQYKKEKDLYWAYASNKWLQNKNRYKRKDGSKNTYFYYCKEEGCKEPRCLNEKKDPEYEYSIKSQFCTFHKKKNLKKASL